MDYPDEVSHPRMFRWLATKNNIRIKEVDLFSPSDDATQMDFYHLLQTMQQMGVEMTSFITLGHVDTIVDPTVELIKEELDGAKAIRRAVRQDPGVSYGGVVGVAGRISYAIDVESVATAGYSGETGSGSVATYYPSIYADEILCLMRKRQLAYPKAYDIADRIMDLNFYKNLKDKYDQLNDLASFSGTGFDSLVFILDRDEEEMIKYVRGERPNPHGKSWTVEKRIVSVMSMDDIHYRVVEILLEEGKINVCDCN
ncbi:hypothetical protein FXO38_08859 [Capsicum annuum]|nr:hypothetical protein FXO37_16046 [Capsicum annuum]KAF3666887.1 hypothetical protein FXO38_08859 [Capsicum annuum]